MTAQAAIRGQGALVSRFAPSPTGRLHLGHAFSAIRAHDFARERGGRFLLRIEDIDGTRSRPEHVAAILDDLAWLGLSWDGPLVFQSERLDLYQAALDELKARGLVYPCFCTRAEIAASLSAPHGATAAYPGTCRALSSEERAARMSEPHCWRLNVEKALILPATGRGTATRSGVVEGAPSQACRLARPPLHQPSAGPPPRSGEDLWWHDEYAGWSHADPAPQGDIVLARKDAPASYHLAVTVDDAAQGVTDVVRGADLFEATHVHRLLQVLLGLPTPAYHHHPLLIDANGERLAKRNGAPTLEALRLAGEDGRALADALRAGRLPIGFAAASP